MDEVITANLRVISVNIKPVASNRAAAVQDDGPEVMEVRASGVWQSEDPAVQSLPASLHITVYPGSAIVPPVGDDIVVTVRRRPPGDWSGSSGTLTVKT